MPRPSPLHPRTSQACETYRYAMWNGYVAVRQYGLSFEREYHAIRQGAAIADLSPRRQYDAQGPEAGAFLSRLCAQDATALAVGRLAPVCWCDGEGRVIDGGILWRLGDDHFRLVASAPALHWLERQADGFEVGVRDVSEVLAAIAVQGPRSTEVVARAIGAEAVEGLAPLEGRSAGAVGVTRTGATGDLGYEIWLPAEEAIATWDRLLEGGHSLGAAPVGLDALDVARVEAGQILRGVDYRGASEPGPTWHRTPFELGLGVDLERDPPFVGQAALRQAREPSKRVVGLAIDPVAVEALAEGAARRRAWRDPVPVYAEGRQIGRATSGAHSPLRKEHLAIATIDATFAAPGTSVFVEWTVDVQRRTAPAVVRALPFIDLERRTA